MGDGQSPFILTKWGDRRMSRKILPYILLIPTFIVIITFIYWPAAYSFKLSMYRVSPFGNRMIFVGLKNFKKLFEDTQYLTAMKTTLIYVSVSVIIVIFLSFTISLLLNMKVPGTPIYKALIFIPYAISPAIAGTLWAFLFNPVVGFVHYNLSHYFGINVDWFTEKPYALILVILTSVWKVMPFDIIFYLAGLQNIPEDVLEAATLDGASSWTKTWKIVFPLLSPITFYLIIMNIISFMFSSFAIIDVVTRGGPGDYTTTLIYRLYLDAFAFQKTGIAAAESVILFIIMAVVTFIYFYFGERRVHYQ